jgi:lipopolysaccharide assembly outer membrane protein LptD (OstA)
MRSVLLSVFCSAIAGGVLLAGCGTTEPKAAVEAAARSEAQAAKEQLSSVQTAVLRGGQLRGGDAHGRPLWSLGAKEIRALTSAGDKGQSAFGVPKHALLLEARATLYREGKPDSTFKAAQIEMFNTPQGMRLKMTGGVTAQSAGPMVGNRGPVTVKAPRADVDVKQRILSASGGVKVNQREVQLESAALRSQTSLSNMDLTGGVTAKTKGSVLKAVTANWDWGKDKVTAQKPVAQQGDTTLSGDVLVANTLTQIGQITGGVKAKGPKGEATAPSMSFDWEHNRIEARDAVFNGQGSTLRAGTLRTDSQLKVANASDVVVEREGATLKAASATGFDKLSRLNGNGVTYEKDGAHVEANAASWGDGRVQGRGGVTLRKQGIEITGDRVDGDDKFENAQISGAVRGKMPNGGTLRAARVEKRGDKILANEGVNATFPVTGPYKQLTVTGDRLETTADGAVAVLTGHVQVTSETGAVLRAPSARYDRQAQKITATGGVYFKDPRGLEQRGETLVADLNLKQAVLTNVRGQVAGKLFQGKNLFR